MKKNRKSSDLEEEDFGKHCGKRKKNILTHSYIMTPFDAPGKQAF